MLYHEPCFALYQKLISAVFLKLTSICNCICQIPLVIFKREKELARKLEFDGLYITEQPEDDDIKGQWDRLVLNTPYVDREIFCLLSDAS